ncbi:MAG TPA: phage baseplate assembly protein V [Armatimonadota bacterium]|jgi:phage baseplate assembly protein gpV
MSDTWSLIRIGEVVAVDHARCRARVHFEDLDVTSDWLRLGVRGSKSTREYWTPAIGEPVVCGYLSSGTEEGFVLCSYYPHDVPDGGAGVRYTVFPDGSMVRWDNGLLTVVATGGVHITGPVVITGTLDVSENITSQADVLAGEISLAEHTHISAGPGSPTSGPQ